MLVRSCRLSGTESFAHVDLKWPYLYILTWPVNGCRPQGKCMSLILAKAVYSWGCLPTHAQWLQPKNPFLGGFWWFPVHYSASLEGVSRTFLRAETLYLYLSPTHGKGPYSFQGFLKLSTCFFMRICAFTYVLSHSSLSTALLSTFKTLVGQIPEQKPTQNAWVKNWWRGKSCWRLGMRRGRK